MAKSLGEKVPFTMISASEVYSHEMSKMEILTQALRRSIGITLTEEVEFIEGEVVEIQIGRSVVDVQSPFFLDRVDNQDTRKGKLTIQTTHMRASYDLGPEMIEALSNENVIAGDIITIDKSTGKINKLGRSFAVKKDDDPVDAYTNYMNVPNGELEKPRKVTNTVSLHDIDVLNSSPQGPLALFAGDTGEIKSEIRNQVNVKVSHWKEEGKVTEICPGVLFIDDAHMLDVDCFAFLNRAIEDTLSPIVVMASNEGITKVKGTNDKAPYGMPKDFLDRILVIQTTEYTNDELKEILRIRYGF